LSEDNYEQNACLYYTIQQKMYCEDQSITTNTSPLVCSEVNVNKDFMNLLSYVEDIKKVSTTMSSNEQAASMFPAPIQETRPNLSNFEEKISDLTKYAKASEEDIRQRLKTLPKIQQAKELSKINEMYQLLDAYQNLDVEQIGSVQEGQRILEGLSRLFLSTNKDQHINFEELIFKTTPGINLDLIKQKGIANAVENLLVRNSISSVGKVEKSRSLAKYNKYKNAMAEMAQDQFEDRLEKQFEELPYK